MLSLKRMRHKQQLTTVEQQNIPSSSLRSLYSLVSRSPQYFYPLTMNDYMNLQLLQQQRAQMKMFPPVGRRGSLLACLDEDGKIDPMRYIEYSRMKRANFLYHMNHLFPESGGAANLIPSSSTTTPSWSTMMAVNRMNQHRNNSLLGSSNSSRHSSLLMSGLPSSLPGASTGASSKMDFSRTGVFAPRMKAMLEMGMDISNTSMISTASSFATSPSLQTTNMAPINTMLAEAKTLQVQQQLRQDEYDAAEALLFGMGRACPSSEDHAKSDGGKTKKKNGKKKAVSPVVKKQQSKKKMSLPTKKNKKSTITPKKTKKVVETDDEVDRNTPVKNE